MPTPSRGLERRGTLERSAQRRPRKRPAWGYNCRAIEALVESGGPLNLGCFHEVTCVLYLLPTKDFHERVEVLALRAEALVENGRVLLLREKLPQHLHERLGPGFLVFRSLSLSEHLDKHATASPLLDVRSLWFCRCFHRHLQSTILTTVEGQASTDRRPIWILEECPAHRLQADSEKGCGQREVSVLRLYVVLDHVSPSEWSFRLLRKHGRQE